MYHLIQDDSREVKQLIFPNSLKVQVLEAMHDQVGHQALEKPTALSKK